MRSLIALGVLAFLITACGTPSKKATVESRYSYSNSFEMADPVNLELVRNWNNALVAGKIDQAFSYVGDSLELIFADGTRYNTTKDSVRKVVDKMLPAMTNLKVRFIAGIPVTSKDKGDTWVLSYTDESFTGGGNAVRYIAHELYLIKNGKIRVLFAYEQQPTSADLVTDGGGSGYSYSGAFEMMDNDYLEIVQGMNDALVTKNFDLVGTYLADSVSAMFPDGTLINGKDSLMAVARKVFEKTDIKIDYVAAMVVRSTDKRGEWVLLWTNETWTSPEGVVRFNYHGAFQIVNGKIRFFREFTGKEKKG